MVPSILSRIIKSRIKKRDESLVGMGLKVLRFDDIQVLRETDAVLEVIYAEVMRRLKQNSNSPGPL